MSTAATHHEPILLEYKPDPCDAFLERVIFSLKGLTHLEHELQKLDIDQTTYNTAQCLLDRSRQFLKDLNGFTQQQITKRPRKTEFRRLTGAGAQHSPHRNSRR